MKRIENNILQFIIDFKLFFLPARDLKLLKILKVSERNFLHVEVKKN